MRIILKVLLFPVVLVLTVLVAFCRFICLFSGMILGIVAVLLFLPWTYLKGGHATVDLLYTHLPAWARRGVLMISDLLMLAVWLLMTRKLFEGMLEKKQYMETTFILQMPLWWAYAACVVGAVIGCLAYLARTATLFGLGKEPAGWTTEAGVH